MLSLFSHTFVAPSNLGGPGAPGEKKKEQKKQRFEPKAPTRIGKRKKKGPSVATKLPKFYPTVKCKLRALKLERIKDYLLLEEEFIRNQEVLRPKQETEEKERDKVEDIRGTPLSVGTYSNEVERFIC